MNALEVLGNIALGVVSSTMRAKLYIAILSVEQLDKSDPILRNRMRSLIDKSVHYNGMMEFVWTRFDRNLAAIARSVFMVTPHTTSE